MKKTNNRWLGFAIGVLLPIIGVFGINQYQFPQLDFEEFLHYGWKIKSIGTWLRVAALLNILPFMLFVNNQRLKTAQGVFFGTLVHAALIVYIIIVS